MIQPPKPVPCPNCGCSGYTERDISMLVLPKDGLKCKGCDHIVLQNNQPVWANTR